MSQNTENDTPKNSLPDWRECSLRVDNSGWAKSCGRAEDDGDFYANPIHRFIYEYDDSDPYRSAWFLHRLELLINFVREEAKNEPKHSNN